MRHYFKIIIGLLLMMGGCGFTTDYFSDDKKHEQDLELEKAEKLAASPTSATAVFDSVYTETTIKVMGVRTKSYDVKYYFFVDGKQYSGNYISFNNPPETPIIEVKYLAEDPSNNSANPEKKVESLKNSKESKATLYIGLVLLLVGAVNAYGGYANIRKQKQEEERASEERIKAYNKKHGIGLDQ